MELDKNKVTSGNIPTKTLKTIAWDIWVLLTDLNISSIQNKLNELKTLISDSFDILCIAESMLDKSFLNNGIALEGFKKRYRLDVTASSGGLLIYVKTTLPSNFINHYDFQKDMECIAM